MNVGIGTPRHRNTRDIKENLKKLVADDPIFKDSILLHAGSGMLPARRHLDSLVANGFMCAGDSASQINPVSGGGIAQSMMGGYQCAHVAIQAIRYGDVSENNLWDLNLIYAKCDGNESIGYGPCMFDGSAQDATEILKIFTLHLSDRDLNFAMKNFMDSSMLSKMSNGDATALSFSTKMKIVVKSIPKLLLLLKFNRIVILIAQIKDLYKIYPKTPDAFPEWKKRLDAIYDEVYKIAK